MSAIIRQPILIPEVSVALVQERKVLLLMRQNTGYEDGKYHLPSGHVEKGESFVSAAIRETKEELGVDITSCQLRFGTVIDRALQHGRLSLFFLCNAWSGQPGNREPAKCSYIRWYPVDDLPENIIPFVRNAIRNIFARIPYAIDCT